MERPNKVDDRASLKTITSNSFITAKGLSSLSLKARKMLYIAISQCRKTDCQFYTFEISAVDFAKLMGITPQAVYQDAKVIARELMKGTLEVVPRGKKEFRMYSLFSTCEYTKNGVILFKLNPDMTEFLLQLKRDFSQPLLQDFLKMKSPYSMAVWHLMQREMHSRKPGITDTIEFDLMLDEMRTATGTENKLLQIKGFKTRVLDQALEEIKNNCGVKITYANIKKNRKVVGFHFKAIMASIHVNEEDIPQSTKDRCELFALKQKAKQTGLTILEQERYDMLDARINRLNIDLSF